MSIQEGELIRLVSLQTSRIWDGQTGETKSEFRGHDNVVEVAVFAPVASYPALRELAGIAVSLHPDSAFD